MRLRSRVLSERVGFFGQGNERIRMSDINECRVCKRSSMESIDFDEIFDSFDDYVQWKAEQD